jgi:hypothetical protein
LQEANILYHDTGQPEPALTFEPAGLVHAAIRFRTLAAPSL